MKYIKYNNILIDKDQEYFWTPEWQEAEKEADEEIARGDVSEIFNNAEDFIKYLNS